MTEFDPVEFGRSVGETIRAVVAPLLKRIEELESRQAERGEQGPQGAPGRDAEPVAVPDVVAELLATDALKDLVGLQVAESVAEHFEAHPVQHGKDGAEGLRGATGEKGERGRDGLDVKDMFRADGGRLMAVLSDGSTKDLGQFVGHDGAPGRDGVDGKDGLSFEHAKGAFDPERGFVLSLTNGERATEFVLPYMRHGGFWSEGKGAKPGESWTHDGALWIAKCETSAKPCIENKEDWILAARKGRDGKDGRNGIDKTAAVKVGDDA